MNKIGLWKVTGKTLGRIAESEIDLERRLADWIARYPNLIQDGLTVVGRQVQVEGGRIDLLAVDPHGRWAVIEVKRGTLRREVITQAIDYASSIASLPADQLRSKVAPYIESQGLDVRTLLADRSPGNANHPPSREVLLFVVGTGRGSGVERMSDFLTQAGMNITTIIFDVFEGPGGSLILAREISEPETTPAAPASQSRKMSVAAVRGMAEKTGVGPLVGRVLDIAKSMELYLRPFPTSVMITPPQNHSRMLFTVWGPSEDGMVKMFVGHAPFAEYFPITERAVARLLGPQGWRWFDKAELKRFLTGLRDLMRRVNAIRR